MKFTIHYYILFLSFIIPFSVISQSYSDGEIKNIIAQFKEDPRGPYYRIKWFCKDGTIRDAKDPCPDDIGGGIQHASYKDKTIALANKNHLFFGDILAGQDFNVFLDKKNHFNRLKQYQLAKYLSSVDNGWILRKAQYYRGAVQIEDEQAWGKRFFTWLLQNEQLIDEYYFLIRQALRDIPHSDDTNLAQKMRSESKVLAEEYPEFMELRIKIHGNPEPSDIQLVNSFFNEHKKNVSKEIKNTFYKLLRTMKAYHADVDFDDLNQQLSSLKGNSSLNGILKHFVATNRNSSEKEIIHNITEALCEIRENISSVENPKDRLVILDFSNDLENILLKKVQTWKPNRLNELLKKTQLLVQASKGTGLIESWEYGTIESDLYINNTSESIKLTDLHRFLNAVRKAVAWSTATVKANYDDVVLTYYNFEPLAYGFIDDRVRSTIALNLGENVNLLGELISKHDAKKNNVLDISNQSNIRGLNPGYAQGKLIVVKENAEKIRVNPKNIYVFYQPPSDLKPVAGIMTVSEGNLVSHVQLLARNLGIPNATLTYENLTALSKYSGKHVFYAVSPSGNVIIKLKEDMSLAEKKLFNKKERNTQMITVPTDAIVLKDTGILNMRDINASDSGKLCGPKAANLGALKQLFPDHVVEGIVIPFGVFKSHMDKKIPNKNLSYWEFLNETFKEAEKMKNQGTSPQKIEQYQLERLAQLRKAILAIELDDQFVKQLTNTFKETFDAPLGKAPVFLRSDTNMEDLEEFTGAGLNLTLFNIIKKKDILEGIKKVWASPYTERSFKWRQQYLLNPENVFPSILIIPSVDVDYSGVLITKGINEGNDNDLTLAVSRGAGGAVDGQKAETRLISPTKHQLLYPARQPNFIRLPKTGGVKKHYTGFSKPILNEQNIQDIRWLASVVAEKIGKKSNYKGAYDIEFGFKDNKLWLFQIRPFVENKNAKSSEYLKSISSKKNTSKKIALKSKL